MGMAKLDEYWKKLDRRKKTWIVVGLFVFIVIILILIIGEQPQERVVEVPQKSYITESLADLNAKWEGYTKAKKQSLWETKYKGKYVKWYAYVKQMDISTSGYHLLGNINPPTPNTILSDVGVRFNKDQLNKLVDYDKGSLIYFEGKIKSYGAPLINPNIFYVTDADILETFPESEIETEDDLPTEELMVSCIASGIAIETCREAIMQTPIMDSTASQYTSLKKSVMATKNISNCYQLNEGDIYDCIGSMTSKSGNPEDCYGLPGSAEKYCISMVIRYEAHELEDCERLRGEDKDDCYNRLAYMVYLEKDYNLSADYCNLIEVNQAQKEACLDRALARNPYWQEQRQK